MKLHSLIALVLTLLLYPLTLHANPDLPARIANLEEHLSILESKLSIGHSTGHQGNLPTLQTKLLDLEEKVRELNGKVQYFDHSYKQLIEKINKLSIDTNHKLSALESKSGIHKTTVPDATLIDPYIKMIEAKNYPHAISGLREYIRVNKDIIDLDEAYYWIGKAYMSQEMYEESGHYFFKSYTQYPHKHKASESLLNVAVSFMKMEKYNSGCKILDSLDREYPHRSAAERSMSAEMRTFMECPS